jgi:hypothetical protein
VSAHSAREHRFRPTELGGQRLTRAYVLAGVAFIGAGIAAIGYGIVILSRTGIVTHAVKWLASLTRDPRSEAPHHDEPTVSGPDDPPSGTRARIE